MAMPPERRLRLKAAKAAGEAKARRQLRRKKIRTIRIAIGATTEICFDLKKLNNVGNMKDSSAILRLLILRHDFAHNMEFRTDSVVVRYK